MALFSFFFLANSAAASTTVSGTISGNVIWTKANGPYIIANGITVPAGSTLTIEPGTVVKIQGYFLNYIYGTLTVGAAGGETVVITSLRDDSVGGDTNGDGSATQPAAGDWMTLYFIGGSSGTFNNVDIRYGGLPNGSSMPVGAVYSDGAIISITHSSISHFVQYGIMQSSGTTTVSDTKFSDMQDGMVSNYGYTESTNNSFSEMSRGILAHKGTLKIGNNDFNGVTDRAAVIDGTVAFNNQGGNIGGHAIEISGTIDTPTTWPKDGVPYVIPYFLTITKKASLTIAPGAIVKLLGNHFIYIFGNLTVGENGGEGTVVTSLRDDSVGGDTNGDGSATQPAAGDWLAWYFIDGSNGTIRNTEFRYGGHPNGPTMPLGSVYNQGGTIDINHSTIDHGVDYGIFQTYGTTTVSDSQLKDAPSGLGSQNGYFRSEHNTFSGCVTGISASNGTLEISDNDITGCSGDRAVSLDARTTFLDHGGNRGNGGIAILGTMSSDQRWVKDDVPYHIVGDLSIPAANTLSVDPGAVIKIGSNRFLYVYGSLNIGSSSSTDTVYVTSMKDDTVGGDSNRDGTSTLPVAGDWLSIYFIGTSRGTIRNAEFRYGGKWNGPWVPTGEILNQGGTINIAASKFLDPENDGFQQTGGTTTIEDSEFARAGRDGIFVQTGTLSINDSSIHNSAQYGVYNATTNTVDATYNWWGAPNGPKFPPDPFNPDQGNGDMVSAYVNFRPYLGFDPVDICHLNCNSNVLFLPGIESSRLYKPDYNGGTETLWEPHGDASALPLAHDASGESVRSDIYTRDILDNAYFPSKGNIYESFISMMNGLKAAGTINDWEAVPYDWRQSLDDILTYGNDINGRIYYAGDLRATTSPYIIQELKRLAKSSRTGKVTIIAHSNGGLVAKRLTQVLGNDAQLLIDKIIFVAVPQVGTPQAIAALLHGDDQGLPINAFPYEFSQKAARSLAINLPMTYNLLPSQNYFTYVDDPVITFDGSLPDWIGDYGSEIHSITRLKNFITDTTRTRPSYDDLITPEIGNGTLFDQGSSIHEVSLDNWTPPNGVDLIQIAGWGMPTTLSGIDYQRVHKCISYTLITRTCTGYEDVLQPVLRNTVDGDGTVVVPSALWTGTGSGVKNYWFDLKEYNKKHQVSTLANLAPFKHANILEINNLLDFLSDIITSSSKSLPAYTYISTASPTSIETRLRFVLHSPLSLDLYDSMGRHTGVSTTTGEIEENIPGTAYEEFAEGKYLFSDATDTLHIVMRGYATGTFAFDINEYQGDIPIATTSWKDMPVTPDTIVTIDPGSRIESIGDLIIDLNGDGHVDLDLAPKIGGIVTLPQEKIPLTAIADDKTVLLGDAIPSLTATITGFEAGDTATSSLSGNIECTTTAISQSMVGTYPIACSQGTIISEKYYLKTFIPGTLTIDYRWKGFLQPINDPIRDPSQTASVFKAGSTVPVKFQLGKYDGTSVQANTAPIWLSPQKGSAMSATVDEITYSDPATSGTSYRFDPTSQQYIYNWSTKGLAPGYWYRIYAKLDDGTVRSVVVGLR